MEPKFSTLPKKPPQSEFCGLPRKPRSPQAGGLLASCPSPSPVRSLQRPSLSPEFGEPHPTSQSLTSVLFPRSLCSLSSGELPQKALKSLRSVASLRSLCNAARSPVTSLQSPFKAWNLVSPAPTPHSPNFSTFPRKISPVS